jgi:hypothetical protein
VWFDLGFDSWTELFRAQFRVTEANAVVLGLFRPDLMEDGLSQTAASFERFLTYVNPSACPPSPERPPASDAESITRLMALERESLEVRKLVQMVNESLRHQTNVSNSMLARNSDDIDVLTNREREAQLEIRGLRLTPTDSSEAAQRQEDVRRQVTACLRRVVGDSYEFKVYSDLA